MLIDHRSSFIDQTVALTVQRTSRHDGGNQACRSPGRTLPEVDLSDVRKQLVIWEKDPVHVLQLLFITRYRRSQAFRAYHITAASRAAAWTLSVQLSSEFSGKHCIVVETNAVGEGTEQPGGRLCCSRRVGSFEIPAQNQSWKCSVLSAGFGA